MYFIIVWGLMVVIPALSVIVEAFSTHSPDIVWLVAKWFVFWGVGIRLLTAGFHQVSQPSFTARSIFRIDSPDAEKLVSEIGYGNLAIGAVATLSICFPVFTVPLGLVGGIFLGLAGIKHISNAGRTAKENAALITDLVIGVVGCGSAVLLLLR